MRRSPSFDDSGAFFIKSKRLQLMLFQEFIGILVSLLLSLLQPFQAFLLVGLAANAFIQIIAIEETG